MDKQEQAEKEYLSGMKYKDIAAKYDVSINTVKFWKKWYDWQRGSKKGAHKNEGADKGLNAKRELFCQLVGAKRLPLYRAYMIAYQVAIDNNAVRVKALRLRNNPKINEKIVNVQREVAAKHNWSLDTVVGELTFIHDVHHNGWIAKGQLRRHAQLTRPHY